MHLIDFHKDVFVVTDIGLVRQLNEDNCYAADTPNGFLFVVCDGMGGHAGGANASTIAVHSIVDFFTKDYHAMIPTALTDSLVLANSRILDAAKEHPELTGMGTTACVVLIRDDQVWLAHIGDSRIYLFCHKKQRLHRLTKDHSVVQSLIDQGLISEVEAEHHSDKNKIYKTLGIKSLIKPDVSTMPVLPAKNDVLLICSDGLSGMVDDEVLQHVLKQQTSLQEKGNNMLSLAKQAGGTDNITLQLIHISNSPHKQSFFESKNASTTTTPKRNKFYLLASFALFLMGLASVFLLHPSRTEQQETNLTPIVEPKNQLMKWETETKDMIFIGNTNQGAKCYCKPQERKARIIKEGVVVYDTVNDIFYKGQLQHNEDNTFGEVKGTGIVYKNGKYDNF